MDVRRHLILLALVLAACGDNGSGDEAGAPTATLTELETEIFAKSCTFAACHKGASPAGGLNLEGMTHAKLVDVMATGVPRPLVVPGDPEGSYFYEKLTATMPAVGDPMPPGAPLSATKLEMVRSWIAAGAADD